MHGTLAQPSNHWTRLSSDRLVLLAGLFWLFTYALLSIRAGMIPESVPALLSGRRLAAVTLGAAIFYAAARHLIRTAGGPRPMNILATIAVSVVAACIIRLGIDQWAFDNVMPVSYSLRWTLVWTGYFGLCLMGTLAHFEAQARAQRIRFEPVCAPVAEAAAVPVAQKADVEAWDWLLDVLAAEIGARAPADRKALVDHLSMNVGYEHADALLHEEEVQNARVRLARAVASRLENARP